jgi:DNA-binding NarL/FixJ family response regulator
MGLLAMVDDFSVMIVDDHELFLESFAQLLQSRGIRVVATAESPSLALANPNLDEVDLIFVDLDLGGEDGIELGRKILARRPLAKVVALTASHQAERVEDAIRSGFYGYFHKNISFGRLIHSIESVLDGQMIFPRPSQSEIERSVDDEEAARAADHLTETERNVLTLLARGLSGAEISAQLTIAPATVRTHVQNILVKLQVHSRLEAVAFALRHSIVDIRSLRN